MTKEMVFIVIDGIDMRAYTRLDTTLLENYTSINGRTIIMRAMFLERED